MLGYLDLQDADGMAVRFHGAGEASRRVTKVQGLPGLGSAGPRASSYDAPWRHGSITRSRWMRPAIVTIEGLLHGSTAAENQAQYDQLSAALHDAIDTGRTLTWERPDGVGLQATARLEADLGLDVISANVWRYQAHLRLDDPRGYAQQLVRGLGVSLALKGGITAPVKAPVTADPSPGGTVAVNNTGNRPTPPVFRVYGLAASAQIVLVGTDARITLATTINSGDYLELDVANRTARLNGTSPAQGMLNAAQTTWFELPRGTSTVRLLAAISDGSTHVDVDFRPAYA